MDNEVYDDDDIMTADEWHEYRKQQILDGTCELDDLYDIYLEGVRNGKAIIEEKIKNEIRGDKEGFIPVERKILTDGAPSWFWTGNEHEFSIKGKDEAFEVVETLEEYISEWEWQDAERVRIVIERGPLQSAEELQVLKDKEYKNSLDKADINF